MLVRKFRKYVTATIGVAALCGILACQKPPAPPSTPPPTTPQAGQFVEHVIKYSGETLADIAAWYTGKAINWMAIRDANPSLRPERLRIGQLVLIPQEIVVNEQPMPRSFIQRSGRSEATPTPSAEATTPAAEPTPEATPSAEATAAPEETPEPAATPVSAETPEPTIPEVPVVATPTPGAKNVSPEDAEREKLLDELLK